MKYQYTPILANDSKGRLKRRPLVEVELFGPKNSIKIQNALIDSGADNCLFNIDYAKYIGIDLEKCQRQPFQGIADKSSDGYMAEVELSVKHINRKMNILVGFIDSNSVDALLGQEGFFDNHRIKFEKDHNVFEINPIKKK